MKRKLTFYSILSIELLFCFTPLGSIPIGPIVATLSMIPAIITSLLLSPIDGMKMGFATGLFSFLVWTFMPPNPALAFLFTPFYESMGYKGNFGSLIICFVPRMLCGLIPGLIYKIKNNNLFLALASIVGSFTNTFLVMLFIYVFFRAKYESIIGNSILYIIITTITTNGVAEALITLAVCPVIVEVLKRIIS